MTTPYPYQLRLPLAPYGSSGAPTRKTCEYRADGSCHIMSDRGEIELIDNAGGPYSPDPVSVVKLP